MRRTDDVALPRLPEDLGEADHRDGPRVDEVGEHSAGPDRGELIDVANEHNTGPWGHGAHELIHEYHVDHRRLIHDQQIDIERMVAITLEAAEPGVKLQQAMNGPGFLPRGFA